MRGLYGMMRLARYGARRNYYAQRRQRSNGDVQSKQQARGGCGLVLLVLLASLTAMIIVSLALTVPAVFFTVMGAAIVGLMIYLIRCATSKKEGNR